MYVIHPHVVTPLQIFFTKTWGDQIWNTFIKPWHHTEITVCWCVGIFYPTFSSADKNLLDKKLQIQGFNCILLTPQLYEEIQMINPISYKKHYFCIIVVIYEEQISSFTWRKYKLFF